MKSEKKEKNMKILINCAGCGLGNNGGTNTIVKSAKVLQDLGHDVSILAGLNRYTWNDVEVPVITHPNKPDVVINTSVWDAQITVKMHAPKKVWWIRGWEKWVYGEERLMYLIRLFSAYEGKVIANSTWLQKRVNTIGIDCELCYSGIDFDHWQNIKPHDERKFIGIEKHKHKTKNYEFAVDLCNELGIKYKEFNIKDPKGLNDHTMNKLYNECSVWFAPTELEGFHNPPVEACLSGGTGLCNNIESNGMGDYTNDFTAMMYNDKFEAEHWLRYPDHSKRIKMEELIRKKIGSREKNMKKFVALI